LQDGILTEEAAKQLQLTEASFVNRTYMIDGGLDCVFVDDSF
jgi:hypothetical protein